MGLFSKSASPSASSSVPAPQDPATILEGHPEVPDCVTPYEAGLISALGKTSGDLSKATEGVMQALVQSARASPYTYGDDSSASSSTLSCNDEKQLVKDCLARIAQEVKARRFDGASDAASSSNTVAPPPSFLFANFPSCDSVLKRFTTCTENVAKSYSEGYSARVEEMLKRRQEMQRQSAAPSSLPADE